MKSGPFFAMRQASVATRRERVTPLRAIFAEQIFKASIVREIASSERTPEWLTPSPSLMIREKASMTKKPRREGRATSRRQLLVPRSRAP
jgi:hypothetical protein